MPSSLSELTPMVFNKRLTHLGSEASILSEIYLEYRLQHAEIYHKGVFNDLFILYYAVTQLDLNIN